MSTDFAQRYLQLYDLFSIVARDSQQRDNSTNLPLYFMSRNALSNSICTVFTPNDFRRERERFIQRQTEIEPFSTETVMTLSFTETQISYSQILDLRLSSDLQAKGTIFAGDLQQLIHDKVLQQLYDRDSQICNRN